MSRGQKSGSEVRKRRDILHAHQKGICFWCPREVDKAAATLDELVPRSRGGRQRWGNIVMACWPCNHERGDSDPPAWAVELVKARGVPPK